MKNNFTFLGIALFSTSVNAQLKPVQYTDGSQKN
jgi:hypothetical protein